MSAEILTIVAADEDYGCLEVACLPSGSALIESAMSHKSKIQHD